MLVVLITVASAYVFLASETTSTAESAQGNSSVAMCHMQECNWTAGSWDNGPCVESSACINPGCDALGFCCEKDSDPGCT